MEKQRALEQLKDAYRILGDAIAQADSGDHSVDQFRAVDGFSGGVLPSHPGILRLAEAEALISQSLAALGVSSDLTDRLDAATEGELIRPKSDARRGLAMLGSLAGVPGAGSILDDPQAQMDAAAVRSTAVEARNDIGVILEAHGAEVPDDRPDDVPPPWFLKEPIIYLWGLIGLGLLLWLGFYVRGIIRPG